MKSALSATALALSGAAVLFALPAALRAADETPRDTVERLMPQLLSDDATTRSDAERTLFQLGDAGREEIERLTRDSDPRKAITALRLLQSGKWAKAPKASGEQRVQRESDRESDDDDTTTVRIDDLQQRMERELAQMRKRFEQLDRLGGVTMQMPQLDGLFRTLGGESSGSTIENDRKTTWNVDKDGHVKVTVQDGKDAPEQTFEAKDFDELKKEHPEIAERLEPMIGNGRTFVLRLGDRNGQNLRVLGRGTPLTRVDPLRLEAPQAPVLGVEWSAVPDVLRDQVELPPGGIVVEGVVKDSLAEKLGLAKHDVLVEINGKPVSGSPDVRAALDGAKAGDKVTALVVRKGLKRSLETTK